VLTLLLAALVCTCGATQDVGTWCDLHARGTIGGVTIHDRQLFDVLDAHGHDVDVTTFACASCQQAIKTGGFCEQHRIGFVQQRAYFSWLTYALAHGSSIDTSRLTCSTCKKNAASFGWCDKDRLGIVGPTGFTDRAAYDRTVAALAIVKAADQEAKRCSYCAVAIVTDTQCPFCRISYKGGKRVLQ